MGKIIHLLMSLCAPVLQGEEELRAMVQSNKAGVLLGLKCLTGWGIYY